MTRKLTRRNKQLQRKNLLQIERTEVHEGPLPAPETLARYEQVLPGVAKQIFAMAERQAQHRQSLESISVRGNARAQTRGQWFGLVCFLAAMGVATFLFYNDKNAEGLGTIITAVAGFAAVFGVGKLVQFIERQRRRRDLIRSD